MKKGLTISMAAVLAASSITPAIVAAAPNDDHVVAKTKKKNEEEKPFVERVQVTELTLDKAIQYGLNSTYSLMELEYSIQKLKYQDDIYEDQLDVAESSYEYALKQKEKLTKELEASSKDTANVSIVSQLVELQAELDKLDDESVAIGSVDGVKDLDEKLNKQIELIKKFLDDAQAYVKGYEKGLKEQELKSLESQITSLYYSVRQLENAVDQLDNQRIQLFNNRITARESMKLQITSKFISLVITEEQIELMKQSLETQRSQLNAKKARVELGLMSQKDYEKATREIADLETQISQLEKQLKNDKAVFATTIGITYDEDYELIKPDLGELSLVEQTTSTEELIKNSYDMVNARNQLTIAKDALNNVKDKQNRVKEDEKMAEVDVDVARLNIESLESQLGNAIKNTFYNVQKQYQAMKDAEKDLEEAKEDNADLKIYYDLGLISKQDYDAANIKVKQAEFTYNTAKYQYYILTQQVELMEKGVIVKN